MVEDEVMSTLLDRQETHGRRYPILIEKIGFLISIAIAIYVGQWIWVESNWSNIALWGTTICGLPLGTLLLGEGIARIIQRIHVSSD
jgi:hypothetical protein